MRGVFDDREQEPLQVRRDAELTLGSGALLAISFGLVALCGLCFGLGYAVGHRGSTASPPASPAAATGDQPVASASLTKPSATPQFPQAASPAPVDASQLPADAATPAPGEAAPVPAESVASNAAPAAPQIRPALTPAVETNQSVQPAQPNTVHPAFAPAAAQPVVAPAAGSLMVQIAAVSNVEDAQVLTNALRKRGYTVTARREPADNLIHVRIGPFATPAEANTWKMKLLNDGYNAIVQP